MDIESIFGATDKNEEENLPLGHRSCMLAFF